MRKLPTSELYAGIDLGGTKIQAIVTDADQRVLGQARLATPLDDGVAGVLGGLKEALRQACAQAETDLRSLRGIGLGTPGAVDSARGTVVGAGNLPGFEREVPLAELLGRETGLAVGLDNDVGLALDAEATLGIGREHGSFLGLWWGTGIGGGLILDGKRWHGRGSAGEIGHTVVARGGAICPCGRRGCLEAYAGRRALEGRARALVAQGKRSELFERMRAKGLDRLTSGIWAKSYAKGDPLAVKLLDRAVRAVAAGLASATNLLDLEAIVIGGGMGTRLGEGFREKIEEQMASHLFRPSQPPVLKVTRLGDLAGALGGSLLAHGRAQRGARVRKAS